MKGKTMKHKVIGIVSAIAIAFVFTFGSSLSVHAADVTFTVKSLTESVFTAAATDLKSRDSLWYQKDYIFYEYSSTDFMVTVIPKENNSYIAFVHTDDTDWDLDRVTVFAYASSSAPRKNYRYSKSTGAYISTTTTTTGGTFTLTGTAYYGMYTNMILYQRTFDQEYYPNVIIDVPVNKPYLGLGYPDPNWLFTSGISEEAYWLSMGIDYQKIMADQAQQQTDLLSGISTFLEVGYCTTIGGLFDSKCDAYRQTIKDYYNENVDPFTFWIDVVKAVSTLVTGLVTIGANAVTNGISAISGVFQNTINFVTSVKTLFGFLPDPIDNIANVGLDVSAGVGLLHLVRLVFLKV